MSKININRNTFLEREELLRFQKFMLESPVNKAFLSNSTSWGVIDSSGGGTSMDFKIEVGTNSGTVKLVNDSFGMTASGMLISKKAFDNLAVPSDGAWYWMKIAHAFSNLEEGTLSINANGELTGTNTKFTEVLRGQSTEVPVKIKFFGSSLNTSVYEVVQVENDTNAILMGDSFSVESGLQYIVIGATPLGETITSEQEDGLYLYDDCDITFVVEVIEDTAPAGATEDEQFWIARVKNVGGTVTVEDKREDYWAYYIRNIEDKLSKDANLSDVADVVTARQNLDVLSASEISDTFFSDSGWLSMFSGVAASATGFDVKVRRKGNLTTITGSFTTGSNIAPETIIASIPYPSIGSAAKTTTNVYFTIPEVADSTGNGGFRAYVKAFVAGDTHLQIKTIEGRREVNCVFTVTYINS